jgi:glycosyltransferase involved in cell wall biosynthesis
MSLLTTVIPVYNGEKFLPATLESVAAQTRRPDRVVVLDDGSTDGTARIAKEFSGIQVEHVLNPKNLGLFENHNRALDFSEETDYLHILHANDLIKPDFYEEVLGCFQAGREPAMGFSQYEFIDEEGEVTGAPSQPQFERPREISQKEFLIRQSELKATLIDATVHRTNRQPCGGCDVSFGLGGEGGPAVRDAKETVPVSQARRQHDQRKHEENTGLGRG